MKHITLLIATTSLTNYPKKKEKQDQSTQIPSYHPTTMKVTINSFRAVATWKWDLPEESDDTCGICRVNFEGTCSKCKFPGDDCPIVVGECRHCFHMVRNLFTSSRGGRKSADTLYHSTALATGSRPMRVRANVPCAVNVCSFCRCHEECLVDQSCSFP
jgi:anaphase-promoting complex subunit 11